MSITKGAIDNLWPLVQDWNYDEVNGWWEWIEEEEQIIEDDVIKIEEDLEIPTYQDADEQDFTDFWVWLNYYRWAVNFFMVGLPYLLVASICVAFNLWFNIYLNDWWAEGNIYLMVNSLYSILLVQMSLIVVFEIPILLENIKPLRVFALLSSIAYNIIYAAFAFDVWRLFQLEDGEFTDFDILFTFFLLYNLVMNAGNFILSTAIITKEISLEWLQLGNDAIGGDHDYALGLTEIYIFFREIGWILNPLNWFDTIYYWIKGYM